jgi:membrane associated rhomboid family serine protease
MLPLNDTEPNRYSLFPIMTVFLIAVNSIVLVWELTLPAETLNAVFWLFGSTPSLMWSREGAWNDLEHYLGVLARRHVSPGQ